MSEPLRIERHDDLATVTLDRPERLNALSRSLVDALRAAALELAAQPQVRAVLLTGAGRAFCSGADLLEEELLSSATLTPGEAVERSLREHMNPMVRAWCELPVPVVVAVNGVAAGAGASLALVGDLVIAAESATFIQLFAPKVGLMPDLGSTFHLPRLVGTARAKALAMLGEPLAAAEAVRIGLIWRSVPDATLAEEALRVARALAAGPTQAYRRIKQVFNAEPATTLAEQLERETELQAELADTRDFAEGISAFRAKRPPRFNGT